ncbi:MULTISPECIES: hypothetical protein [unclassified Streptomyces]|uniref:hypothetical protein n=1 Tax=unclassified Streptomyces TaxID=2593676 RepID=UPI002255BE17|nr:MULTISPECIES: hypothetical protein [unclassified Streptomyces]MCX5335756.1 hypothetical protein [Streptomyces sp. NBC_00140]MCX5366472.1 hypothetical protein [Streptomyces sp. NBC_00124]
MSASWALLIPVAALVLIVLGGMAVLRLQKISLGPDELRSAKAPGSSASTGSQDSVQESREEFVRRHWQRSGVVANGVTLVDLYDRIRALEERVARAEQQSASPPPPD